MIKLYVFPPAFGLRNASPFCVKAEMALEYLGLDYQTEILTDPRKAPKGKLPFMDIDGELVADSELMLERLDKETNGRLFGALTADERARGTAFTRLAEDHLYWLLVASRWLDDDWWPNIRQTFFGAMPGIVRAIVAPMARKQVTRAYYLHGLGRHTLDEQKHFAKRDLQAINDAVADGKFIAGDRLTVFDFAVAAQVSSVTDNEPPTWATRLANELPALRDYAHRVQGALPVAGGPGSGRSGVPNTR